MSNIKERLNQYLDAKRYTKTDFGKAIGVSSAYVSSIRQDISNDKIAAIRKAFPDLNTDWLLYGEGEMLNAANETLLKRIATIAEKEGITISELEKRIGASKGTISRAIKNGTDIQAKWVCKIAELFPSHSARWLLTGKNAESGTPVPLPVTILKEDLFRVGHSWGPDDDGNTEVCVFMEGDASGLNKILLRNILRLFGPGYGITGEEDCEYDSGTAFIKFSTNLPWTEALKHCPNPIR